MYSNQFTRFSCLSLLMTGTFLPLLPIAPATAGQPDPILISQIPVQTRPKIAVLNFDFSDTSGNYENFFRGSGPARGVSDLLTNKLVQRGTYSIIERRRIDAILQEQGLGVSGLVDPTTAAQIGKILGVRYVLIGSITRFNLSRDQAGGSGCIRLPFVGCVGGSRNTRMAEVELSARLVDTTTAEIMVAAEGTGTAQQSNSRVVVESVAIGSSTSNEDKLISEAATMAVNQLVDKLVAARASI
jgi:curli biogenesis system outer membrane secretion channel CsgG